MPEIFPLAITGKTRSFDHPSPEYAKLFKHQTIWLVNQNWPEVVKGSVFSTLLSASSMFSFSQEIIATELIMTEIANTQLNGEGENFIFL